MTPSRVRLGILVLGILMSGSRAAGQPAPRQLVVRASLDADQISSDGQLKIWIFIDNQGADAADGVQFDALQLRGFVPVPRCWRGNTPACPPESDRPDSTSSIAPATQMIRWAEFRRVQSDNGRSTLFGSLRWTNARTNEAFRTTVTAAPVQLISTTSTLTTPVLLALITLLGAILTVVVQLIVQRRTERQALFTTLLPKNLENAERYYLPIQTAVERLATAAEPSSIKRLAAAVATSPIRIEPLTFHWLLLSRRMRELQQKAGGFYFKSYLGEELASNVWNGFKKQEFKQDAAAGQPISTALVYQVVGKFDMTSNLGDFTEELARSPTFTADVTTLQKGLAQWVTTDSWTFSLTCVKILDVVLGFEINRPHERWYADSYRREPGTKKLKELAKELQTLTLGGVAADVASRDEIVLQLQEYVTKAWRHGGAAPPPPTPRWSDDPFA